MHNKHLLLILFIFTLYNISNITLHIEKLTKEYICMVSEYSSYLKGIYSYI